LDTLPLPTQAPETPDVEPLVAQAMERRPELLGSKDREQAAQEVVKAARALYFGAVTAIGTAGYTWWAHEERPSGKEVSNPGAQLGFWGVGVTSSFPLYTGGRIEGQVEEAEARNNFAKAETRILANDILLEVVRAYVTRLTAGQLTTVALERASHAREALTLARERYKAGLGSILEVTQATADVLEAENGLADAQYELQGSEFALGYATGSEYPKW
jgi:outer membrane protein